MTINLFSTITIFTAIPIPHSGIAYLAGILAGFMAVRSYMLFWMYEPYRVFARVQLAETTDPRSRVKRITVSWQSYPSRSLLDRAYWTLDLLLDFRGSGWCYSAPYGIPCRFHSATMTKKQQNELMRASLRTYRLLVIMACRAFLGIILLDSVHVYLLPHLQTVKLRGGFLYPTGLSDSEYRPLMDTIHMCIAALTLMALADAFYSLTSLLATTLYLAGATSWLNIATQSAPWGSFENLYLRGISGQYQHCPRSRTDQNYSCYLQASGARFGMITSAPRFV
ncbi:ubiquitin hydrolase [Apiospora saccharicola]